MLDETVQAYLWETKKDLKTEPSRNWVEFNFQWTKILFQNILNNKAFFFILFKGYRSNNLLVICNNIQDNFLREPVKINIKFHKNWKNTV